MVGEREFASSRGKALSLLALSLGFVAIAALLPDDGGDRGWRWLGGGFFGLCAMVLVGLVIRPERVVLDRRGFVISGGLMRSARRVAWRDVDRFFVRPLPHGGRMVCYNLAIDARPDTCLNRRWGADGILPKALSRSPERIAASFNACREAALAR